MSTGSHAQRTLPASRRLPLRPLAATALALLGLALLAALAGPLRTAPRSPLPPSGERAPGAGGASLPLSALGPISATLGASQPGDRIVESGREALARSAPAGLR